MVPISTAVRIPPLDQRRKEDNQSLFGLNLSIPLQMRNDFFAEVAAVRSESTMAAHRLAQANAGPGLRSSPPSAATGRCDRRGRYGNAQGVAPATAP